MNKPTDRGSSPRQRLVSVLAVVTFGWTLGQTTADQPQWGEHYSRNMVSSETGLPESFDPETGRNIRCVARLGSETHSSPIVAGGRVFIGTNNNEPRDSHHQGDRGVLLCFDERARRLL